MPDCANGIKIWASAFPQAYDNEVWLRGISSSQKESMRKEYNNVTMRKPLFDHSLYPDWEKAYHQILSSKTY